MLPGYRRSRYDEACPSCGCATGSCGRKARRSGRCEEHETYFRRREEDRADKALDEALVLLERRVIELAAVLIAPCVRAMGSIDKAREIREEERVTRNDERELSESDLAIQFPRGWKPAVLAEHRPDASDPLGRWRPISASGDITELREDIALSVSETTALMEPPTDCDEPERSLRRPKGADTLTTAGLLQQVKNAAFFVEAIDE